MVSLASPIEPPPTPPPGPLSPQLSAFFVAYTDCKSDIRATAQKLQIPLETALDLLADPALQARLTALDESDKRAARQTAIDTIQRSIAVFSRFSGSQWQDPAVRAAVHLYRASIWLVRIAEGKVTPDRLPQRFRSDHGPPPPAPTGPPQNSNAGIEPEAAILASSQRAIEAAANPSTTRVAAPVPAPIKHTPRPTEAPAANQPGSNSASQPRHDETGPGAETSHQAQGPTPRSTPPLSPASLTSRTGAADTS